MLAAVRIAVVVAGMNDPSNSDFLADAFIEGLQSLEGVQVTKIRLKELSIKHFTLERYHPDCPRDDDFPGVQAAIQEAKGVVIATPIWNFSVPAHLKNFIDRMGAFALDDETHSKGQLKGKPFYLIYTGGAPLIAWKALMYITLMHVTEAIKYYGGIVVGRHFEPKCMQGRGKFGLIVDQRPQSLERLRRSGAAFGAMVRTYAETGSLPFPTNLRYRFFTFRYRVGNRIMYPVAHRQ